MNRKLFTLTLCAAVVVLSAPVLARGNMQHIQADYRAWGTPHASASVAGTQEKTLLHKQSSGHYSVCNQGSHALTVSYDAENAAVDSGDCMAVEAKKISVKGTDDAGFHRAVVFNHSHFHPHHGSR